MVRNVVAFLLLLVCLVLGYQAYENSRVTPETLELSRDAVCSLYGGCARGVPQKVQTDVIRRRYEWLTPQGPYTTTCTRSKVFFGDWSCGDVQPGKLGMDDGY